MCGLFNVRKTRRQQETLLCDKRVLMYLQSKLQYRGYTQKTGGRYKCVFDNVATDRKTYDTMEDMIMKAMSTTILSNMWRHMGLDDNYSSQ